MSANASATMQCGISHGGSAIGAERERIKSAAIALPLLSLSLFSSL
mgnify:CR=1 FL=1